MYTSVSTVHIMCVGDRMYHESCMMPTIIESTTTVKAEMICQHERCLEKHFRSRLLRFELLKPEQTMHSQSVSLPLLHRCCQSGKPVEETRHSLV